MIESARLGKMVATINEGRPLVVLLGQDAWRTNTEQDQVIKAALKRIGRYNEDSINLGMPSLLSNETLPNDFYEWLANLYFHQIEADWLEPIAKLPLSALFTTSINPALSRSLRLQGRDVEAVLSTEDNPTLPRHRKNLHLTYLFGRAGESNPDEAPPNNIKELHRRIALHSISLLSRILETTTPLGTLVIDGLVPSRDWISTQSLYGLLSAFNSGQVYWFGWTPNDDSDDASLLKELTSQGGPVTFVQERLSAVIRSLVLENQIKQLDVFSFADDHAISIKSNVLELDPAIRLKTSASTAILDDSWLTQLPPLGKDASYEEFRRFHGSVESSRKLFEGIQRGFAIKRDFEDSLQARVMEALSDAGRQYEPILIHGQSGSGKSLALARLAFEVKREKRYPILFSCRSSRIPAVDELDDFCLRAEDIGADATLIICDSNAPASRYRDLLRGFQSRGRRAVVVGSMYRHINPTQTASSKNLIEAPAVLSDNEIDCLAKLLKNYTELVYNLKPVHHLLAVIYRFLPSSRPVFAAGLAEEAHVIEDKIRYRGSTKRQSSHDKLGSLGQALFMAGVHISDTLLEDRLDDLLGTLSDSATKLIDYVMMPGKLNCPVPINLLMRAVGGGERLTDIAELLADIDLFRWSTNEEDDIFVQPRLQIEAELITRRRLGTVQAEVETALKLMKNANPNSYGNCERRFLLDLVQRLGPDGPFRHRYATYYLDIAHALTWIRENRDLVDPSLMLQEATLRRRMLRDAPSCVVINPAEILEEARQVVDLALEIFGGGKSLGLRRMCANIKVERAAIYGFRAVQQLRSCASENELWQFYQAAKESVRSAAYVTEKYHAIDVSLWVPDDLLKGREWSPERRAELIADIWDGLDRVDASQLEPDQREIYEERRVKVAQTLNNKALEQSALSALEKMGSSAGLYLQSRAIGGGLVGQGAAGREEKIRAQKVISFMMQYHSKIREDIRCLRYFLRAIWIDTTSTFLFGGERSPIPNSEESIIRILQILEDLVRLEGTLGDPRTEYLQAVLLWRSGQEHRARQIWDTLSQDTAFSDPRRVIRQHIWTDNAGKPRVFHGRIVRDDLGKGRSRVQLEESRQEIELLHRDFPQLDLRRGAEVPGGFFIAFNFIGPVAEPIRRRGVGR